MFLVEEYFTHDVYEPRITWHKDVWPTYAIVNFGDIEYIVGTSNDHNPNDGITQNAEIDGVIDRRILWRMQNVADRTELFLLLGDVIDITSYAHMVHIGDININDAAIHLADKYGLMASEIPSDFDLVDSEQYNKSIYSGIPIALVSGMLEQINAVFESWIHLVWDEELPPNSAAQYLRDWEESHSNERMSLHDACQSVIQMKIQRIDGCISFEYDESKLVQHMVCADLYNAVLLYLGTIISIGESYCDGWSIAVCSNCGDKYMKRHANSSLCQTCRTNKAKLQAHRARKKAEKEAAQNAK